MKTKTGIGLYKRIKSLGIRIALLKALGYDSAYTCCFKGISDAEYHPMTCPKDKWYADPILIEKDGRYFVFMEVFDEKKHLGEIGCTELRDGKCTDVQIVINEKFHLSFPNIIECNGKMYMIPETSNAKELCLYECLEFPYKWKLKQYLLPGVEMVDSVLIRRNGSVFSMLGSECNKHNDLQAKFMLYDISISDVITANLNESVNSKQKYFYYHRNAGPIIDDKWLPLQMSSDVIYGEQMIFVDKEELLEAVFKGNTVDITKCRKMSKTDLKLSDGDRYHNIIGTHTYGKCKNIEVIDIQYLRFNKYKWKQRINKCVKLLNK